MMTILELISDFKDFMYLYAVLFIIVLLFIFIIGYVLKRWNDNNDS
ncbi:MAG: hypothetical protein QXI16_07460 [Sulfolobaceae archaeon]